MNSHKNAKLTPLGRDQIIKRKTAGETSGAIATALGVSPATVCKWVRRHKAEGMAGLQNRSSRPRRLRQKASKDQENAVEALRRQRLPFWKIAVKVGVSRATAARIGKAKGLSRLSDLEPKAGIVRYERDAPGDMIHIDIKRLGRIDGVEHRITGDRHGQSNARARKQGEHGWEYLPLAVDDHSRLAYSEILPDEKRKSCLRFLFNALRFFRRYSIKVHRVMTDNGVPFRSHRYAKALRLLKIRHKKTKPYAPKTNGKAERFVQTSLREWAYARPYETSAKRTESLTLFLHYYNYRRPHFGIEGTTPVSRLPQQNLLRHDI